MKSSVTLVLDEGCAHLENAVAEFAPVLVFRRAGGVRSESRIAVTELLKLLTDRSLLGRVIYVAPSFAGFTALLLANEHRDSLAGILLLEPSHPRQGPEAVRILAGAPASPELEQLRSFLAGFGPVWEQSCHEASQVRDLGDVALHVMAGGRFDLIRELPEEFAARLMHSRHSMLAEYCTLSSRASFEVVDSAGHDLATQAPEVVLAAIKRMLAVSRGEPRSVDISIDDLGGPGIAAFLEEHIRDMRSISPPESKHALDLAGLKIPEITVWTLRVNGRIAGCCALKQLEPCHGEIKSMRTDPSLRRSGLASTLLQHLIRAAVARGYHRLSLETGAMDYFAPARALYRKFGFEACPPFATYTDDPNSAFFTKVLPDPAAPQCNSAPAQTCQG